MAHLSFRARYQPLLRLPRDIRSRYKLMARSNTRVVLSFLVDRPNKATLGEYHREDRMVHFSRPVSWVVTGKAFDSIAAVPRFSVESAVTSLNSYFRSKKLPWRVWLQSNSTVLPNGVKPKQIPVEIGLVDIRRPTKAATEKDELR